MKPKPTLTTLCVILAGAVSVPASLDAATIAWWRFEESSGNTLINSASTGAIYNATQGAAASLSAVTASPFIKDQDGNEYANNQSYQNTANPGSVLADAGAAAALANVFKESFTIEAFVLAGTTPGWRSVFNQDNQAGTGLVIFGFNGDGKLRFYAANGNGSNQSAIAPDALPLNQWVHIAAVGSKSGSDILVQLYIDGTAVGGPTNFWNGIAMDPSSSVVLGGFNQWNVGQMDEVRISGTALAPSEFLTAIPESSSYAYAMLGAGVSWALLRNRKKAAPSTP